MAQTTLMRRFVQLISRPAIWLLIFLFILITFLQYAQLLEHPVFLTNLTANLGLTRYTVERILYLLPIIWASFSFGWIGGAVTSVVAVVCMMPRVLYASPVPEDALVETSAVFIIGNLVSYSIDSLRKERKRRVTEERQTQENLHSLLQQITRAQEEERKRIARELHDDTVQALVVHSQQISDLVSGTEGLPEHVTANLQELRQQVNNIIQGLRRLSQDLRPAALDRLGLLPALRHLSADVTEYSGIITRVELLGVERRLPDEVELVLFRVVQEALRNVWKHAQATEAKVTVEFGQDKIKISVVDNGNGFRLPDKIDDLARNGKLGLAGMKERGQLLGGTLTVQSALGKGSRITIELPIKK